MSSNDNKDQNEDQRPDTDEKIENKTEGKQGAAQPGNQKQNLDRLLPERTHCNARGWRRNVFKNKGFVETKMFFEKFNELFHFSANGLRLLTA